MIEQQIAIPTKDGHTATFIVHPERDGPFPVILFYMDAPAIREELRDMARRLATSGYYVMLPNLYYRSTNGAKAEVEIYPGTHHGFAFPKRPVYDRDAAERHWERLLALYRRNLVQQ